MCMTWFSAINLPDWSKWRDVVWTVAARIVDVRPANVTVRVGSSASVMCHVAGEPSPTVRWLRHDGSEVETADDDDDAVLEMTQDAGLLMINNATLDCDGWYECEASNGVGPAQTRALHVDVLGTYTTSVSPNFWYRSSSSSSSYSFNSTWQNARMLTFIMEIRKLWKLKKSLKPVIG